MSDSTERTRSESRHQQLVALLGAYADDELASDSRREVDAHLAECGLCVQELRIQAALRSRLRVEEPTPELLGASARLGGHVAQLGRGPAVSPHQAASVGEAPRSVLRNPLIAWSGWLIAACLAALWVLGPHRPTSQGMGGMSMGPPVPVSIDSVPEPIADAALHDFKRVAQAALPQGPELQAVESQVPFSVPALKAPHMRLIGAWTTTIDGVPAAALAYRCHDRLVVQYVVPEHVFFRPPRVRQAIAASGLYAAGEGKIHAVGWPGHDNGSFLVGEFGAGELAAMRN
jgi:anti-sigma factor RsiW